MSRNFELLHEAGKVQEMLRQRIETPVATAPVVMIQGAPSLQIDDAAREEVNKLVQRLFLASGTLCPRQVVFAGTERGNGSSWTCAHAADVLASQVSGSVCAVDCDSLFPTLHEEFKVQNHYGLADALLGGEPIRQYVQQLSRPNLWLLSAGSLHENAPQMLSSEKMQRRMAELQAEFDYVLIDTASLDASNHSGVLGSWCDGVALVLKANSSDRKAARKALAGLETANVRVLGAVLNQRTFPVPDRIYRRL